MSRGDAFVRSSAGTLLIQNTLKSSQSFSNTRKNHFLLARDTHCKNDVGLGKGFVYKFRREKDPKPRQKQRRSCSLSSTWSHTLDFQNESWTHSAKRLIFSHMSGTVLQLQDTLSVPVIFSGVLLRDCSIVSVRVHIKTH